MHSEGEDRGSAFTFSFKMLMVKEKMEAPRLLHKKKEEKKSRKTKKKNQKIGKDNNQKQALLYLINSISTIAPSIL